MSLETTVAHKRIIKKVVVQGSRKWDGGSISGHHSHICNAVLKEGVRVHIPNKLEGRDNKSPSV